MIRLALLGIVVCVCARELWVFRFRNHDAEHVFLAGWSLLVGGVLVGRIVHMSAASPSAIVWAIRTQFAFGLAVVPYSLWMVRSFVGLQRTPGFIAAFVGSCAPAVVAILPNVGFESELVARQSLAGSRVWTIPGTAWLGLAFVVTTFALLYMLWVFRRSTPQVDLPAHTYAERRRIMVMGFVLILPPAISDILLFAGWGPGVPVVDYAFVAFVTTASFVLTRRALLSFEALEVWAEERAREMQARQAQLWATDRLASLGILAAGVAHEINNPLTYVTANLDLLDEHLSELERDGPIRESRELIAEAQRGAFAVRDIVADLRVFSRAEKRAREATDVRACVTSAIKMASNVIRQRAELLEDLAEVPFVDADPGELTQVLLNVLVNAAHAIPESESGVIRVVTGTDAEGRVIVSVTDSGEGIPPEVRERIFDPFFTTKPTGVGTGLGLSICHGIVTGLGGTLEVESVVGEGSTFTVRLPAMAGEVEAKPTRKRESTDKHPLPQSRRILVIDDEPLVARALKRVLRDDDVEVVHDGAEGVRRATSESFDVIVCDLMMPRVGGIEVYESLREAKIEDRIVLVTGGAFTPRAIEFLETVDIPRIVKPIDPKELRRTVRRIARRRDRTLAAAPDV